MRKSIEQNFTLLLLFNRFQAALQELLKASNPHAKQSSTGDGSATDCCICLGETAPFQALFIAPCSHCYHYKCVMNILQRSSMFQCPLCRQVANLTASVSVEDLTKPPKPKAETASILSYGTKNDIVMNRLPSVKSSGALSQETNADNLATSPTMPVDGIPRGSSASPHHRRQFSNSSNNSVIQAGNNSNTPGGPANGSSSSNINSTNKDKNKKSFSQKLSTFFNKGGKSSTGVSGSGGAPASNTTTAATTPAVARQAATISPSGSLLPIPATHTSPNNRPTSSESDQNVAAAAAGDGLSPANPDEHKALESENS